MKIYTYFLTGTQVNGQFTAKPKFFIFKLMKYAFVVRLWRFQATISK